MNDASERWLPVPGWEGLYEVSSLGRVRSLRRQTATGMRGGRVLAKVIDATGAHVVLMCDGGRKRFVHIYRLVAEAFIGPQAPGIEVRHLNDDRADDRLSNLAYGSKSENMVDAVLNGKHAHAKLNPEQVREIRQRHASGAPRRLLATEYGVCLTTIGNVIHHNNWKFVA